MMRPISSNLVLALLGLLMALAQGQDDEATICFWMEPRAASIRDALYIEGGTMFKASPNQSPLLYSGNSSAPQTTLYSLNYTVAFDVANSNNTDIFSEVDEGGLKQVTPMYSGYMFADAFELYTYGGLDSQVVITPPPANYAFGWELTENTPGVVTQELGPNPVTLPADITRYTTNGAGVNVPSEQVAFYFSGMTTNAFNFNGPGQTGWTAVDQLIEVDMSIFGSPVWSNNTFGNSHIQPRANAELVWVPFGARGTLIAIGGVINPEELFGALLSTEQIAESENTSPSFMKHLPVYDIANSAWYLQEATGPFPGQLTQFCSVVVNETETSYDIYIYGGYNGLLGSTITSVPPYDDVWVLSVPSFTWTKALPGNSTNGRRGHYCTAPYPDQMFVVGGVGLYGEYCVNPTIKIFNLNTLSWQDRYDPTVYSQKGYQRPSTVANTVKNHPKTAWSESAIETLFNTPYKGNPIVQYWPYHSNAAVHPTSIAAIAGGVIAGCVCLIVLVLAILWYHRKHRKHKKQPGPGDSEVQPYDRVRRWRRSVPKTDASITTTEIGDASEINPNTGGYYKPAAEAPGDQAFNRHSAALPRPGVFAEAGGGTRRVSGGQTITPRSPRSPNTGTLGAQEVEGEERYEMEVLQSHRGSGDMGARHRFRDHHLYPLSVSDGDGRSQASGPSYSGPSHSHSQTSRAEATRGVPSPYLMARPDSGVIHSDSELPASPVRPTHLQHTRNISSISSSFPQVSPPLEQQPNPQPPQHTRTTSEDELDALEAFHTGGAPPFRPSHTRNLSSLSSGINQLPTPVEELSQEEMHRQSTLLARLSPAEGRTPVAEQMSPLLGTGNTVQERAVAGENTAPVGNTGQDVYSPSSYSQGSTLVSGGRSPASRKPVGGQGLGIERVLRDGKEGIGEGRQTL